MRTYKCTIGFGLMVWAVPFFLSLTLTRVFFHDRMLFESIMPVAVALVTAIISYIYFQKINWDFPHVGIRIGIVWLVTAIALDLLFFLEGPMKMSLLSYIKGIGITYLIIPIITTTVGYSLEK